MLLVWSPMSGLFRLRVVQAPCCSGTSTGVWFHTRCKICGIKTPESSTGCWMLTWCTACAQNTWFRHLTHGMPLRCTISLAVRLNDYIGGVRERELPPLRQKFGVPTSKRWLVDQWLRVSPWNTGLHPTRTSSHQEFIPVDPGTIASDWGNDVKFRIRARNAVGWGKYSTEAGGVNPPLTTNHQPSAVSHGCYWPLQFSSIDH